MVTLALKIIPDRIMPETNEQLERDPDGTLRRFLASWNLERIKQMSVEDYADLQNPDSLCYWLEYETKDLGEIGGIRLHKFELWKTDPNKEFQDNRFRLENGFAWSTKHGAHLDVAFQRVKGLVISIVEHSERREWEALDPLPFNAIGKWKIAFLFSDKALVPVYAKPALYRIAAGLALPIDRHAEISVFQRAIQAQKDPAEDMLDFGKRLYITYGAKPKPPKYFIIGSIYNEEGSVIHKFLARKCVAMGWVSWVDFSGLMGGLKQEVNQFVDDHYHEESPRPSTIKGYFRIFSEIAEGDVIAVKSKGSHGALTIIAYAQVVKRTGSIYYHDEDDLGHCIHVEFLDAGFEKYIGENYAWTLHRLTPEKDKDTFYRIFGWYTVTDEEARVTTDERSPEVVPAGFPLGDQENEEEQEEGYNEKSEEAFERSGMAGVLVQQVHSRLQNAFVRYLKAAYPYDRLSGEKSRVDVRRWSENDLYLYEIKPDMSVYTCIRGGIGQLLDYRFQDRSGKVKFLVIVGQSHPNEEDGRFIEDIRAVLQVPFRYIAFDRLTMRAKEF
jgi:hypothetical protein